MITGHRILRWVFAPLALLFGLGVALRNVFYRTGFFQGVRFSIPVISVGNLAVGGAGKTPHVEYLIRLLRPYVHVGVLSRGYGRSTTGFLVVNSGHQSSDAGDESLMYARKYRDVLVAVSESRSGGIPLMMQQRPGTQVILLDDAFQHRSVTPHSSLLLTEYQDPFYKDWLMPVGRLREWRSAYRRADLLIVTKCAPDLATEERDRITAALKPLPHQSVYFTTYGYRPIYPMYPPATPVSLNAELSVLLVSGIARTEYLMEYVSAHVGHVDLLPFGDHHDYSETDLAVIASRYGYLPGEQKIILTTEKDAVRLERHGNQILQLGLPVYILPVEVAFLFGQGPVFDEQIKQVLLDFKV